MNQLRYIAYVRKSTEDEEKQVLSKEAQRDKIKERFPDLNIVVALDESKSAFEPGKRDVFAQMIAMIDKGEADAIVAWHPDRLSRNEVDAGGITWRVRQGIIKDLKFASFSFDNSPEGLMMLQMTMSQSQYFSAKLSKDVKRGNETKRKNGGIAGKAPEGYLNDRLKKTVYPDPERFPVIRKAFDMYLTGEHSVQAVWRALDDWGYTTLKRQKIGGNPLNRSTLYLILRNPRYAGKIPDPHDSEKFYDAAYPAMITVEEYDQVQTLLGNKGATKFKATREFVLRGFIRCAVCGCMITAEKKVKKLAGGSTSEHIYYHCTRRSKAACDQRMNIREADLFEQLKALLDGYELVPKLYEWGMTALSKLAEDEVAERNKVQKMQSTSITGLQTQLDNLLDMATKGLISGEEYQAKSQSLKGDLKKRQEEQADTVGRTRGWYEFVGNTLQTLNLANARFVEGDLGDKKEILLAIGQNPVLRDGKLLIEANPWLNPIKREASTARDQLEAVRTMPQQIQKASEEAVRLNWYRWSESNRHDREVEGF